MQQLTGLNMLARVGGHTLGRVALLPTRTPSSVRAFRRAFSSSSGGRDGGSSRGRFGIGVTTASVALASTVTALFVAKRQRRTNVVEMEGAPAEMPVYRQADVAAHNSMETGVWVTYMGKVYDISEWMDLFVCVRV